MTKPMNHVQTDLNEPILFRTADETVYNSTIGTGSIWLRSNLYYQRLEDETRRDPLESASPGKTEVPLILPNTDDDPTELKGPGYIATGIRPHYIMCMHGSSIKADIRTEFGGYTLGIRNPIKLAEAVSHACKEKLNCTRFIVGSVVYRYVPMCITDNLNGAIVLCEQDAPPRSLTPWIVDPMTKRPELPFILQDEWRIVIFTEDYLEPTGMDPLKINVSPDHFYRYIEP